MVEAMTALDPAHVCETCRFWSAPVSALAVYKYAEGVGECRKHAPRGPVMHAHAKRGRPQWLVTSPFPVTPKDDWCGEWAAKP